MFDVIVIGGGPGGYVASIRLSKLGKNVALIEKNELGGTCTNVGCIPTKALLSASHLYSEMNDKGKRFGVTAEELNYDESKIMKHSKKAITLSRKGIEHLLNKNNVEIIEGTAEIIDKGKIRIKESGTFVEGKNLILAQGSNPANFPPFEDVEGIMTSDDVFSMEKFPESILIIGGGYIGVEFATFFSSFGVKVHLVEVLDQILSTEDKDVAEDIKKSLKRKGVIVLENTEVTTVEKENGTFTSTIKNNEKDEQQELKTESVLLAVGRKPAITEDIKALGVEIDKGIITDDHMCTNIENVYAIGDIKAKYMLAHTAMHEGIVAAENIAGIDTKMDYSAIPSVIFSNPEVASVGLREKDVEKEKIKVSKFPVSATGRARTMEERIGFAKVISDKKDDTVLGLTIVSPNATEMIMEGVIAVRNKLTTLQLMESVHPHPTLTETVLGALEKANDREIHI